MSSAPHAAWRNAQAGQNKDAAITAAIIAMSRSLHIEPVAEGVETPEQLEYLQRQGCGLMQGFLFSRPVPAENLTETLRRGAYAKSSAASGNEAGSVSGKRG